MSPGRRGLAAAFLAAGLTSLVASGAAADAARQVLLDFRKEQGPAQLEIETEGGSLRVAEGGLRLEAEGEAPALASITPEEGRWDLSRFAFVVVEVRNAGGLPLLVRARVENPGSNGLSDACVAELALAPSAEGALRVTLVRRPEDPGFEPFAEFLRYARAVNVRQGTLDPARIARLVVELDDPPAGAVLDLVRVTAGGEGPSAPVAFFPFVDEFGQYVHGDWPGKLRSSEDFAVRRAQEEADLAEWPGPEEWNQYGGWATGPQLDATGFFYPAKHEGQWWLVDPEGRLFWSFGPTGVGYGEDTPITDREHWFAWLPERASPLGGYYGRGRGARTGYYQEREYETYDFASANLRRKYGENYRDAIADLSHRRLRSWGFNTIANWSDEQVYLRRRTPYVVAIHYGGAPWMRIPGGDGMPDPFDPGFRQTLAARLDREIGRTAGDPWCIGYFVDNELSWGHWDKGSLVVHHIVQGPPAAAKRAFVDDLQAKYGAVAALNQAWGTAHESWDALLEGRDPPDPRNPEVAADYGAFGLKLAERYFSIVREEVKRVAPDNLYLGPRFHGHIDLPIIELAARYTDVISYNVYGADPGGRLDRYLGVVDRPFVVGEFGIGSDPMQTPFRGEPGDVDPRERTRYLARYLERAFRHPLMVGAHFFQYRDQPITGRADGEAVLRGLVNTADTPHAELVRVSRRAGYHLYQARAEADRRLPEEEAKEGGQLDSAEASDSSITLWGGDVDAWAWTRRVQGESRCDRAGAAVVVSVNGHQVQAEREGQRFSAVVPLAEGQNEVVAQCRHDDEGWCGSAAITITQRLVRRPTARISVEVGLEGVLLAGGQSEPAEGGPPLVDYSWRPRPGNPAPLRARQPAQWRGSPRLELAPPTEDGEYYVSLTVTDADGRTDRATAYFVVEEGEPRAVDPLAETASWVERAVAYGVVPHNFGAPGEGFRGVIARLDDLADLGITAIWLSPSNASCTRGHSYSVTCHLSLREDYGTKEDFRRLVREAHARGIRVLMDIVPNHTSAHHPYMQHARDHGRASPYWDFYDRDPATGEYAYYFYWRHLPNLNYDHPEVRRWMMEAFAYWVREFDVDGFRVDAAWGVQQRRPDFLPALAAELTRIKPDLLLLAEASARDPFWFTHGFGAAYDWSDELGRWAWERVWSDPERVVARLRAALTNRGRGFHPRALIFRFLNNNDTGPRFITRHGLGLTRVAAAMLLTLPGLPCLYTGQEVGAEFEPYRQLHPISWEDPHGLRPHYRGLVRLRREMPSLHSREWELLRARSDRQVLAYARYGSREGDQPLLVALNFSAEAARAQVSLTRRSRAFAEADRLADLLGMAPVSANAGKGGIVLSLPGHSAAVLAPER